MLGLAEDYLGASSDMSSADGKVRLAAGIVAGSEGTVKIVEAMRLAGFGTPERKTMRLCQQVRRRAAKMSIVDSSKQGKNPPLQVNLNSQSSNVSTLTATLEEEASTPNSNGIPAVEAVGAGNSQVGRKAGYKTPIKGKPTRRTSRELQRYNAGLIVSRNQEKEAMKQATLKTHRNNQLPKNHPGRKSIRVIVAETNSAMNTNISAKTVGDYVRKNLIGISPLKRGPTGALSARIYRSLKGAFVTYLKLEQAESKKQSTTKQMARLVNACVNKAGHNKTRDDLTRKLKKDTANEFDLGKANVVEQRRLMWTTAYNLDIWFDTFKQTLIELGFAREKGPGDDVEGEVVFFPGQTRRIINLDETDGSLDDTTGQRGGRPPMTFLAPEILGGGTAVNKSGYSSTVICGSNAAGEPLPPHFQLKSTAQTPENQRIGVEWILNTKDVVGQFGYNERRAHPCTFGMNEKAGMNAVELDKYFTGSILPLYPDIEDIALKRVLMKVDSGPGRMNVEMLANLQVRGLYLVPGVPNSTAKTQETDQNYGMYKSVVRDNLRVLSQARFDRKESLHVSDLPILIFGGVCTVTRIKLRDAFTESFSVERNLSCWRKCGAVPLTRAPLQSASVRREVPVGAAAAAHANGPSDPAVDHLRNLEDLNKFYCSLLSANGFDGEQLRRYAPKRSTVVAVTQEHSVERMRAIRKARTAGQMFYATGGRHLNSDEFFKAKARAANDGAIKEMEEAKKQRQLYCKSQKAAVLLIRKKGDLRADNEATFTLPEVKTLLKWKRAGKPVTGTKKADLVKLYVATPKPTKPQKVWSRSEEAALQALKVENMPLRNTAVGVATGQMARAVTHNLAQLDDETRAALTKSLQEYEDSNNPNAI